MGSQISVIYPSPRTHSSFFVPQFSTSDAAALLQWFKNNSCSFFTFDCFLHSLAHLVPPFKIIEPVLCPLSLSCVNPQPSEVTHAWRISHPSPPREPHCSYSGSLWLKTKLFVLLLVVVPCKLQSMYFPWIATHFPSLLPWWGIT